MYSSNPVQRLTMGIALIACTLCVQAADPQKSAETKATPAAKAAPAAKSTPTDEELIASARSAAPAKVSHNATIVAMNADGSMRTLHKGTNGFTCMPDEPSTPGPDPMCVDANSMEFVHALMAHKPPPAGKVGFMYMLAGGTDATRSDGASVRYQLTGRARDASDRILRPSCGVGGDGRAREWSSGVVGDAELHGGAAEVYAEVKGNRVSGTGDLGLGTWDWGLGTGDWAQG